MPRVHALIGRYRGRDSYRFTACVLYYVRQIALVRDLSLNDNNEGSIEYIVAVVVSEGALRACGLPSHNSRQFCTDAI